MNHYCLLLSTSELPATTSLFCSNIMQFHGGAGGGARGATHPTSQEQAPPTEGPAQPARVGETETTGADMVLNILKSL